MLLTILADDLTGACDTGCLFAGPGPVAVCVHPALPDAAERAAAVDTESRSLPAEAAGDRLRRVAGHLAQRLRGGRAVKKIDSTFRGPVGAEIDAVLSATGLEGALVCPAFPAQRRVVLHGVLHVDGRPAHESPVGRDPDYPGHTSDLPAILSAQTGRRPALVPLAQVRAAGPGLARALDEAPAGLIVADAETDADLAALASVAVSRPTLLVAGSAGLARALAMRLGVLPAPPPVPSGRDGLVVAGRLHPATRAQLEHLAGSGVAGAWIDPEGPEASGDAVAALRSGKPAFLTTRPPAGPPTPEARARAAAALARAGAAVLAEATPTLLCVAGGDTARALLAAMGFVRLEVLGAPSDGLALGRLGAPDRPSLPVLTKAGGFGPPDLFTTLLQRN